MTFVDHSLILVVTWTFCVDTADVFHGSFIQPFSNRSYKKPTNMYSNQ